MVPGGNILDTAPKSNTELRHPEWGYPSASNVASSPRSYQTARASVKKSQNVTSLEMFLSRHNIPHETLSGGHLMIRLKEQVHFQRVLHGYLLNLKTGFETLVTIWLEELMLMS